MAVLAKLCLRYRWSVVVGDTVSGNIYSILDQLFSLVLIIVPMEVILGSPWVRVLYAAGAGCMLLLYCFAISTASESLMLRFLKRM